MATTQASAPAPLAGDRVTRPVRCSGDGALHERARSDRPHDPPPPHLL